MQRRDDDALPPSGLTLGQRTQIGVSLTKNARSCKPDVNARGGEVIFRWRELAKKPDNVQNDVRQAGRDIFRCSFEWGIGPRGGHPDQE